jgi:predicted ribosome quality control (RQC) complex YloA/Tae2 family protein
LARYSSPSLEIKEAPSFAIAADEYYSKAERPNPKLEKLEKRLEKQQERLLELQTEEVQNRTAGDFIYHNYQKVEHVLELAKSGKFEELERKHQGKADKKEKSVEVEL